MRKFLQDRPTLRGFLIIGLIALGVVALNQYTALTAIAMLLRIAFFLAVALFNILIWRGRRGRIDRVWARARAVLYGAALHLVGAIGLYFWHGFPGYEQLGFLGIVAGGGYSMFRVWRGRHSYS